MFFITYFLQANFFNWFNIAGIKPNVFVILILIMGLYSNKYVSYSMATILGLLLDFFCGKAIGIYGIIFLLTVILAKTLDKNFSKDNRMIIMSMVASLTIVYETIFYTFNILKFSASVDILGYLKVLVVEIIFNILITIIIYPLIQKIGSYIENSFKPKGVITRYL